MYREKTSGYQEGERGSQGHTGVESWEVQTTVYKIGYKHVLYNMGNISNIL